MSELLHYRCPSCGGMMEFDSASQKMKCPSCSSLLDVEAFDDSLVTAGDKPEYAGSVWQEGETENIRIYSCQGCGGEIVADQNTGATKCPYCGSNVVMKGQFSDQLKPDYVIPFKLDKNAAMEAYRAHIKGKKFVPSLFTSGSYIDEIRGVYVPFWLFDMDVDVDMTCTGEKVRVWTSGDTEYTEVKEYDIHRQGRIRFEKVPADSSRKMDDALMESLEPYDTKDLTEFKTAYLAGYLADRYDVDREDGLERVRKRVKKSTEDAFLETIRGYSNLHVRECEIRMDRNKYYYALFPVWMLSSRFKGEIYTFALNAQNGKMIGDLPFDPGSYWKYIAIRTLIIGLILAVIMLVFLR